MRFEFEFLTILIVHDALKAQRWWDLINDDCDFILHIINWMFYSFSISFKLYINIWSGAIVSFWNWLKYYISTIFFLLNSSFIVHRKPWTVLMNVWFSYVCSTAVRCTHIYQIIFIIKWSKWVLYTVFLSEWIG